MAASIAKDAVKRTFVPLENNPLVFSQLSQTLGVEPDLSFYDVYSIDDPDLLALVPRPVYALLFTCPHEVFGRARVTERETMAEYEGSGANEPVMWFRQTIGHACGLMGLLHGLSSSAAKIYIKPNSDLDKLLKDAVPLKPTDRAQLLYDSKELETAHGAAAQIGDTRAPRPEEDNWNHYICFVKGTDGHLWELNGGMKGPLDRGALAKSEDMLSERALQLGVRDIMAHAGRDDVDFSIVALAPSPDRSTG